MPSSLGQILQDPEFGNFSYDEKVRIVREAAPDFGALSDPDQQAALSSMGIARPGPSVADSARSRLSARGLTPEMVKSGTLSAPGEMRPASGSENARAFGVNAATGGLGALAQIPAMAFDYSADAMTAGPLRRLAKGVGEYYGGGNANPNFGSMPTHATEAVGSARRVATDAGKELTGVPHEAITDTADFAGRATGEIAASFVPVPGAARNAVAGGLERSAVNQYTKALVPSKANRALAEETVPQLIKRGETFANPKNLAGRMDDAADAVPVDDAVRHMKSPARTKPIISEIETQRDALYNVIEKYPAPNDPKPLIDSLKGKRPTAEVFERNGEIIVREIRHPDMQGKVDRLHEVERHVRDSANRGMLKNETALNLRKDYDYHSDPEAGRFRDIDPVRRPADSHVADALRKQINADPVAGPLNAEKSFYMDAKTLADAAPAPKPIMTPTLSAVTGGIGFAAGGPGGLAAAGIPTLIRFMQSPAYRTVAAVTKDRIAGLIRNGQIDEAVAIAGSAMQETEQNRYLQSLMQGGQ